MKRLISLLLSLCLIVGLMPLAYAEDSGGADDVTAEQTTQDGSDGQTQDQDQEQPPEAEGDTPAEDENPADDSPAEVGTLEDLQAAIDAAEDGDTITVNKEIYIYENNETGKIVIGADDITVRLVPSDDFNGSNLLFIHAFANENIILQNLILDGNSYEYLNAIDTEMRNVIEDIGDLTLKNVEISNFISNDRVVGFYYAHVKMENCTISNNQGKRTGGIEVDDSADGYFSGCKFENNRSQNNGGAIRSSGNITLTDCDIRNNLIGTPENLTWSGGGIYMGETANCTISNCTIVDNAAYIGGGICVEYGKIEVKDSLIYGNHATYGGDDIQASRNANLIITYSDGMKSIYTENNPVGFYADDKEDKFDKDNHAVFRGEEINCTVPDNAYGLKFIFQNDLPEPEHTEPSQEPQPPINQGDEGQTQEPQEQQPQPQEPEPPQDSGKDEEPPQEPPTSPAEGDDDGGNDYTPPAHWWHTTPTNPAPTEQEIPDADTPLGDAPKLICNNAVIDASRSVVLQGYGDGLLHEDDPLTRAQLATIIYRLLDDNSIAQYSGGECAFSDVAPGAWYAPFVQTINRAGIVCGVGAGQYAPEDCVTWAQIITVISRFVEAQSYDLQNIIYEGWAQSAVETAVALGWMEDSADFSADAIITRGELVEFVNTVLAMYQ